jgi:CheY-like chemotaxis protein
MARILLVDDEKQQLMLRATILQAQGYEVVATMSGAEAVAQFQQQHFDLVITDWLMPAMTGLDISQQLKSYRPNTPIILLTGWGSLIEADQLNACGVDALLSKPCDADKLILKVKDVLSLSEAANVAASEIKKASRDSHQLMPAETNPFLLN